MVNKKLNEPTNLDSKKYVLDRYNKFQETNTNRRTRFSGQYLIMLIGNDSVDFDFLKKELKSNKIKVLVINDPYAKELITYALNIDSIIVSFDLLEQTMKMINECDLLKSLYIPIVAYQKKEDDFSRRISYLQGVDDYITNSINTSEMLIRINRQITRKDHLNSQIFLDELTGAYNRKGLNVIYLQQSALKNNQSFLLLDIDTFKEINDRFSYLIGDQVLTIFVKEMMKFIDKEDMLIRLGGDEFIIISPYKTIDNLRHIVLSAQDLFSNLVFEYDGEKIYCTFSAGLLSIKPSEMNLNYAIERAQTLVKQSKLVGGNQLYIL